jgi:hypothetical protein
LPPLSSLSSSFNALAHDQVDRSCDINSVYETALQDSTLAFGEENTEEAKMDSAFVLANDPRVEPLIDNEQEKIEQLKEVVSRIQDRNCEHS